MTEYAECWFCGAPVHFWTEEYPDPNAEISVWVKLRKISCSNPSCMFQNFTDMGEATPVWTGTGARELDTFRKVYTAPMKSIRTLRELFDMPEPGPGEED